MNRLIKKLLSLALIISVVTTTTATVANAAYDGEKAARYAKKYASTPGSESGYNSYYKAYDADCTNFASQCLRDGGLIPTSSSSKAFGTNNETSAWYHDQYIRWDTLFGIKYNERKDWKVSTTWVRVSNTGSGKGLFQYLTSTKKFTYIAAKSIDDVVKYAEVGDIIQCAKSGEAKSHSVIVTSTKDKDIGVTYHTTNRKDVSFKSYLYPNYQTFYIIKVK